MEITELKYEIAELKSELNKLKSLVTTQNVKKDNISEQNMDALIKEKFLKLNIDEHVKQIIHTSQKKSHDTLDKKISQTNTLINNLQLDFKKTRDLLTDLKNEW